jgi:CBS-domain-containing membrane protein
MRGHVIGCLPIVDGKRLVGIVTTSDLLDMIGRESAANRLQPRAADEEALSEEDEAPLIRS